MRKLIVTLVLSFLVVSAGFGKKTDSLDQLSPLIKTNPLKTSFNHYMFVKNGDCDTFSTRHRPNSFPLNTRIIDTDFNMLKQTPYLHGLYFFDGQSLAERIYFQTFSAPSSPPSILTVKGQHYYIPGGWDTFPLENICSYRFGNKIEFCRLDTGETFATFDFTVTKHPPYLLEGGKLAVMFDKSSINLLDLENQKVLHQTKSIQNWDAGNGVFVTPSAILNYRTGESFDLSNLGLDISLTQILIKNDFIEFHVDTDRNSKMSDNPRIVRVGFNGRTIETIQMSFMPKGQDFRIIQSKDDIVLVNSWQSQFSAEAEVAVYDRSSKKLLWENTFGNDSVVFDEVLITNDKEPKVIFHVCNQMVKLDLRTGIIEKSIYSVYQQVNDSRLAFVKGNLVYAMQENTNCVFDKYSIEKMDSQGNKAPVEIPFQVYEALIDSFEDKDYLVSRKMMADMSALIVDTAIIDPKTGVATKSISFVAEGIDAKAVTLDGKFLFYVWGNQANGL